MKNKQLIALLLCNTGTFIVGASLFPILPIYVKKLGGDSSTAGFYLSLAFAALAAGSLVSGWLADRFQKRRLMIIGAGFISTPAIILMGQVHSITALALLTSVMMFSGGIIISMASTLTGMFAPREERGRIFGVMGMSSSIASLIAGFASGRIIDNFSYEALFIVVALAHSIVIFAGYAAEDRVLPRQNQVRPKSRTAMNNKTFWAMVISSTLIFILHFGTGLGRPLAMNDLNFNATAITSTIAISGLFTLPAPFLMGWLADRVDRRRLLISLYVTMVFGSLTLAFASELWHFWVSTILLRVSGTSMSVGSAIITDMLPSDVLGKGLSRYNTTQWIGGVIGYGFTGMIIEALNIEATFALAIVLPLAGIWMVSDLKPYRVDITMTQPMVAVGD